jgi:putative flippase GtrA
MKTVVQKAIRYAAVSACALIIDITVLFILVHYLSWWYVAAATASFMVGLLVGYVLLVGVVINAAVISFGVKTLGLHYLIAKCGAAGFTFVWNFVARRQFLFVQRHKA